MRVLVTGGAGFIGSTVVDRLLAHGHEVHVVDDLSSGRLENLEEARTEGSVHFQNLDIRDDALHALLAHVHPEVVCHLAAQVSVSRSVGNPVLDADVNIMGTLNVLRASVNAGVRKVCFASSGGAMYGDAAELPIREDAPAWPASPYGISKRAAEYYIRHFRAEHGVDFTSLALANVYGPRQDPYGEAGVVAAFCERLVRGQPPTIFGTGEYTRDYVFVGDVAHAFVLALDAGGGETVHIATGKETSVNDLYRLMAGVVGFAEDANHGPPRPGDVPRSVLATSKAKRVLGWEPFTDLPDGLRETLAWFRAQLA